MMMMVTMTTTATVTENEAIHICPGFLWEGDCLEE
jgi:hypothetical protein